MLYVQYIVGRSGSMRGFEEQAIDGINTGLKHLRDENVEGLVSMVFFDSHHAKLAMDHSMKDVPVAETVDLTPDALQPRGMTPLRDAVGVVAAELSERMKEGDHLHLIIVTDGQENASNEYSQEKIKSILDEYDRKGFLVNFIGADFDAWSDASGFGMKQGKVMRTSKGKGFAAGMAATTRMTAAYARASKAGSDMQSWVEKADYSDEVREDAVKE